MKTAIGILLLSAFAVLAVAGDTPFRSDFTGAQHAADRDLRARKGGVFTGTLPVGWLENYAGWNQAEASGGIVKSDGEPFFRFQVRKLPSFGAPQFRCDIPALRPGVPYRLTLKIRNRSEGHAMLQYRAAAAPYRELWSRKIMPREEWQLLSAKIILRELPDGPKAIYLVLSGIGEFDLKELEIAPMAEDGPPAALLDTRFYEGSPRELPPPWRKTPVGAPDRITNLGAHFFRLIDAGSLTAKLPDNRVRRWRLAVYACNPGSEPVRCVLKKNNAVLATALLPPGGDWVRHEFDMNTPEPPDELALLLPGDGFRVAQLTLAPAGTEPAGATVRPAPGCLNYFRNSRLPLGLQSGWNVMSYRFDGTASPDPSCIGPSGEAALALTTRPGGVFGVVSEPFAVAESPAEHTVSFSYLGSGNYTAAVVSEDKVLARKRLPAADRWRRCAMTFSAPPENRAFALKLEGESGALRVDAFRAAPGGAGDYMPAAACEVALALPDSDVSGARIQFLDEAPLIRYHVSGEVAPGTRLRFSVTDLYGETRELESVALTPERRSGTIRLNFRSGRTLGQFRIEARAVRDGLAVSPDNELVLTRLNRPRFWGKDAPDSPFGVHVPANRQRVAALKAGGFNHVRLHDAGTEYTGWFHLEPAPGEWRFRDAELRVYRDCHMRILGQLGTAPRWASYLSRCDTGRSTPSYHDRYFQPLDLETFRNYVLTVCRRYKDDIDEWFVWNEPWNVSWWATGYDPKVAAHGGYLAGKDAQVRFAAMNKLARDAAKSVNPAIRILGTWTNGLPPESAAPDYEIVDFHYYTDQVIGYPGDGAAQTFQEKVTPGRNGKKPRIYMTEGQGASQPGMSGDTSLRYAGILKRSVPWRNDENHRSLADRSIRFLASLQGLGVDRIFLYSAHTFNNLSAAPHFLTMFQADGYPHPMLAAHSAYAWRMEGKPFAGVFAPAPGVWCYLFGGENGSTAVLLPRGGAAGVRIGSSLPAATAADLYGNPLPLPVRLGAETVYIDAPVAPEVLKHALFAVPPGR